MLMAASGSSRILNLFAFQPISRVNGPGTRTVVWVQGCPIRCPGCWNQDTWAFESRTQMSVEEVFAKIESVRDKIDGVTLLGGEPFVQAEALTELGRLCQEAELTMLTYTGYTIEFLYSSKAPPGSAELLAVTDTLIDGPFVQRLRSDDLVWRGSSNQRIIHLTDRMVDPFGDEEATTFGREACEVTIETSGQLSFSQDQPQGVDFSQLQADLAKLGVQIQMIGRKENE